MFHQLLGQVSLVLMLLVCGWALWRGEKPERLAAAAMVAAWIGTSFVLDRRFEDVQWAALGVDFALLVVLIGLSLAYRRRWLLAACGFHLLGVATHGAMIIDPHVQAAPLHRRPRRLELRHRGLPGRRHGGPHPFPRGRPMSRLPFPRPSS